MQPSTLELFPTSLIPPRSPIYNNTLILPQRLLAQQSYLRCPSKQGVASSPALFTVCEVSYCRTELETAHLFSCRAGPAVTQPGHLVVLSGNSNCCSHLKPTRSGTSPAWGWPAPVTEQLLRQSANRNENPWRRCARSLYREALWLWGVLYRQHGWDTPFVPEEVGSQEHPLTGVHFRDRYFINGHLL